jgi:hypothetical protein
MKIFNQIKISFGEFFEHLMHGQNLIQNNTSYNFSSHLFLTEKQQLQIIESVNILKF